MRSRLRGLSRPTWVSEDFLPAGAAAPRAAAAAGATAAAARASGEKARLSLFGALFATDVAENSNLIRNRATVYS